jgi:hypothetical protein
MEQSQKSTKRPYSKDLEEPFPKTRKVEATTLADPSWSTYERLVQICQKLGESDEWKFDLLNDDERTLLADLAADVGMDNVIPVDPKPVCKKLLEIYKPIGHNVPDRGDLFAIIMEFLQDETTYNPGETKERTTIAAIRIASAYTPYNVMPAIRTVLQYIAHVVTQPPPGGANSPSRELLIGTVITDLLTWLNSLDNCGNIEVVYVGKYPVTVSTDAELVLDRQSPNDSGGISTSQLHIVTPVYGLHRTSVLYTAYPESQQARRWFKNMLESDNQWEFDERGYDPEGKTMQDYVDGMASMNIDRFPLDRFWFVLDGNNKVVAVVGYQESIRQNGPYRIWGFGYPKKDKDGTPYLHLLFGCMPDSDCYAYVQQILEQKNWKLVTSCSPAFNPYNPKYALLWILLHDVGLSTASQAKSTDSIVVPSRFIDQFESLRFTVIEDDGKNSWLLMPEGWTRAKTATESDRIHDILFDEKGMPRVLIDGKTSIHDECMYVSFLNEKESQELAESPKKERNESKQILLRKRSPYWTKQTPFGVFHIKNTEEMENAGCTKYSNKKACLGYWAEEEDAESAQTIANTDSRDLVFVNRVDSSDLDDIAKIGYVTVNGLEDPHWWNVSDSVWQQMKYSMPSF